jgi:hypothetical protein
MQSEEMALLVAVCSLSNAFAESSDWVEEVIDKRKGAYCKKHQRQDYY